MALLSAHAPAPGARELFLLEGGGGVKTMRATFREVHKSVINDNRETQS